jgi:uncharacterized protein (DUF1810 family)
MADRYELTRFVEAQDGVWAEALRELETGRKCTHWMWFVFPQCVGLGSSPMAQRFAISGLDEARAYLEHPQLGLRLKACTAAVNAVAGRGATDIFGSPDDLKFRSSMTLFARADPAAPEFSTALATYFGGLPDPRTLEILAVG